MNREISFGAYDKRNKKMYEFADIDSEHSCCLNAYNMDGSRYEGNEPEEDLIPLQCAGFKDKNGKKIFEGNILIDHNAADILKGRYIEVKWNQSLVGFEPFCLHQDEEGNIVDPQGKYGVEIIGNIYENPELL